MPYGLNIEINAKARLAKPRGARWSASSRDSDHAAATVDPRLSEKARPAACLRSLKWAWYWLQSSSVAVRKAAAWRRATGLQPSSVARSNAPARCPTSRRAFVNK